MVNGRALNHRVHRYAIEQVLILRIDPVRLMRRQKNIRSGTRCRLPSWLVRITDPVPTFPLAVDLDQTGATRRRFIPANDLFQHPIKILSCETYMLSPSSGLVIGLTHHTGNRFALLCSVNHRQPKREASHCSNDSTSCCVNYRNRILFP